LAKHTQRSRADQLGQHFHVGIPPKCGVMTVEKSFRRNARAQQEKAQQTEDFADSRIDQVGTACGEAENSDRLKLS
jgi:hypothetical protein